MYWKNIIPVFLVHEFNVKSIFCIVNYMIISYESGILYTDICMGDFFNKHDFMKHWVEVMLCYNSLWPKIEPKCWYKWLRAKRSEGALAKRRQTPFTIYSWTIQIMCYVKV